MESTFESFDDEDFDIKEWVNAQVLFSHFLAVPSGNAKGTRCVCFVGDHGVRIRGTKGWANTIRDVCDALGTVWDQARVLPDTKLHGVFVPTRCKTSLIRPSQQSLMNLLFLQALVCLSWLGLLLFFLKIKKEQ